MEKSNNKKRRLRIAIVIITALIVVITIGCAVYVSDYYHADTVAIDAFAPAGTSSGNISKEVIADGIIAYVPSDDENDTDEAGNAKTGFIFYPGGKVEYTAYEPLMKACAEKGILCVLIEMPFNLAVLDVDAADGIIEMYPEVDYWYIGGHSLGGSMAASYLSDNIEAFDGLVLLGSYSTADLSQLDDIKVLSIYGSEDLVLDHEKYQKYSTNLPEDFEELVIEGGCHAYFGMYGAQDGDGIPTITNEEQIEITTETILNFM